MIVPGSCQYFKLRFIMFPVTVSGPSRLDPKEHTEVVMEKSKKGVAVPHEFCICEDAVSKNLHQLNICSWIFKNLSNSSFESG